MDEHNQDIFSRHYLSIFKKGQERPPSPLFAPLILKYHWQIHFYYSDILMNPLHSPTSQENARDRGLCLEARNSACQKSGAQALGWDPGRWGWTLGWTHRFFTKRVSPYSEKFVLSTLLHIFVCGTILFTWTKISYLKFGDFIFLEINEAQQ